MHRFIFLILLTLCCDITAFSINQAPQLGSLVVVEHGKLYQDEKPLRVGIVRFDSPYIIQKTSEYSGPMIEVVHQVLSATGYHFRFTVDSQDTLMEALKTGQLDVVFGVPQYDNVHPMLLYSMPYMDIPNPAESSRIYLIACASLEHYTLMRRMNRKMLIQKSGYYLGYLKKNGSEAVSTYMTI